VLLVVLEEFHDVLQVFYCVFEALIHKNVDVELLVSPVDFKNWLETGQEGCRLGVS